MVLESKSSNTASDPNFSIWKIFGAWFLFFNRNSANFVATAGWQELLRYANICYMSFDKAGKNRVPKQENKSGRLNYAFR